MKTVVPASVRRCSAATKCAALFALVSAAAGCSAEAPTDDEVLAAVRDYYDNQGIFAGEYAIKDFLCTDVGQPTDGIVSAHVAYKFCQANACAKMAGVDVRVFTLVHNDGWYVQSMGDFLGGTCDPGPIDPLEVTLISHKWSLSAYDYPDEPSAASTQHGPVWEFAQTAPANGQLYISNQSSGNWWLSEIPWGDFTLTETFDWYVVLHIEGAQAFSYGVKSASDTMLELQHDVGLNSNRIDRFTAQ